MAKNTVVVSVLGDTKPLSKSFSAFGKVASGVAVAGAAIATAIGVKAVRSASALEQAMGGLNAVFKDAAPQMEGYAKAAAGAVGLAQSEYAQLATVLGSQLKNMGVATEQLGDKTNELVGLGADLAAQFGGSTSDAVSALSSLLRGERDPIERYGVSINEARIQAKLAELGLAGLTGEALTQAKTQATLALLYEQTADAQGAFSRESMTLAGQQERLRAGTENLYAVLGTALLPAATAVTAALASLVASVQGSDAFAAFTGGLTAASTAFQDFVVGIMNGESIDFGSMFAGLLDGAVSGITNAANWLASGGALTIVNGIVAGRTAIFDAAFSVFPAILEALIVAIPAIVTGIVALVTQLANMLVTQAPIILAGAVQLFTSLLTALVTVLPSLVAGIVAILPPLITTLLAMIPAILDAAIQVFTALVESLPIILPLLITAIVELLPVLIETILGLIPAILDAAVDLFTALVEAIPIILPLLINAIFTLLPRIVSTVVGMIPKILDAAVRLFTGIVEAIPKIIPQLIPTLLSLGPEMVGALIKIVPQLLRAGADLIGGLVRGLINAGGSVGKALLDIAGGAVKGFLSFFGIKSPSRLFMGYGEMIDRGLSDGLRRGVGHIGRAMDVVNNAVTGGFDAELSSAGVNVAVSGGLGSSSSQPGAIYQITVQALAPSPEIGRAVVSAIQEYESAGGRGR